MEKYHKINTIFMRDEKKKIIKGQWTLPEFEYLQNNIWNFYEKIDGMNIRINWDGNKVTYDGRNDNSSLPAYLVTHLLNFNSEKFEEHFKGIPVTLYGEGFGYGIMGKMGAAYSQNFVDSKSCSFILFDVKIDGYWLEKNNVEDIAQKLYIPVVPLISQGTLHDAISICEQGFISKLGNIIAEGLVMVPKTEIYTRMGERIIAKLKMRDFK